jgi:hypothetical protein
LLARRERGEGAAVLALFDVVFVLALALAVGGKEGGGALHVAARLGLHNDLQQRGIKTWYNV